MNNETHTPEPWFIGDTPGYLALGQWKDGKSRFSDPITIRSASHTEEIATVWTYLLPTNANARRIVACVNACAGIDTDSLVGWSLASSQANWFDQNAALLDQRDELAEALRGIVDLAAEAVAWREESTDPEDQEENLLIAYRASVEQARAALAKLK